MDTSMQVVFAWFNLAIAKTMTMAMTGDSSVVAVIVVHRLSGRHYHVTHIQVYLHLWTLTHMDTHTMCISILAFYLYVSFPLALSQRGVDYFNYCMQLLQHC